LYISHNIWCFIFTWYRLYVCYYCTSSIWTWEEHWDDYCINTTNFSSYWVIWRTTHWICLCLLPDCIFLLMLLFYIHRYILNECYNCTSSIRTGSVYNSDLSFLAFLSCCVVCYTTNWWTLCIFSDFCI
jgi:hypothetical protein